MEIELGQKIRDRVTGLKGIATGRCEYLNGCVQYHLKPALDKDGKMVDGDWIDVTQLEVVGRGISTITPARPRARVPGGPMAEAPPSH